MVCLSRPYHFKSFKGSLPQILLGPFLNILTQIRISMSGVQPEIFLGRGGFVKLGHFDKHFLKKWRKNATQGNILEFFLLDTFKTAFWMANLT